MPKPTHASVTDQPCTCDYLQNAASESDNPIVFNEATSEYHFTYREPGLEGPSMLVIYHCPFCGGMARQSKRPELFQVIPRAEQERLFDLLSPAQTIDQALAEFGPPDFDGFIGTHSQEQDGQPPCMERHRQIRYEGLSETADVWITEEPDGRTRIRLLGKERRK